MRNIFKVMAMLLLAIFVLAACGGNDDGGSAEDTETAEETNDGADASESSDDPLKVVTTFSILTDIVEQLAGDQNVEIHNLVPIGTDPHEYEPLPEDIKAATDADVLIYNGVNLEGGDHGWFAKLIDSVGQSDDNVFQASEGVEPMYLMSDDGTEEEINPHVFLDPNVGMLMAENTRDALIAADPDNKEEYEKNTEEYLDRLKEIDQDYEERLGEIPEENRTIVTSERAYQYMADRYGLKEGFIWAIDTEENGTPEQITTLVKFIEENNPPVLFVESNVDDRPMETVSNETGVEIFEDMLYSDEIGSPGEEGDTYVKFLMYNIDKIHKGLMQE